MKFDDHETANIKTLSAVRLPKNTIKKGKIINPEQLGKSLREAFETAKPTPIQSSEIIFEIPDEVSFHYHFTLPSSLSEKQIREAALFEAAKVIPFEIDKVSWDTKAIKHSTKNNLILFVATPLDLVQKYYEFFIDFGVTPLGFSSKIENILRAFGQTKSPFTITLDLQSKYSTVIFSVGDILLSFKQINIGEDNLKKAIHRQLKIPKKDVYKKLHKFSVVDINLATFSTMKKLDEKLKKILISFEKIKKNISPELLEQKTEQGDKTGSKYKFVFVGNKALYPAFKNFFQEHKNQKINHLQGNLKQLLSPSINLPQNSKLFTSRSAKQEKKAASRKPLDLKKTTLQKLIPNAIGASLADYTNKAEPNRSLNLLPISVRSIALWKQTNPWFYLMASLILLFSIGWLMVFGFSWGSTLAQLRVAQNNLILVERQFDYKNSGNIEKQILAVNEELKILYNLKAGNIPFADITKSIRKTLSEDIVFKSLSFDSATEEVLFALNGIAKNREQVIQSYQNIQKLPFIKTVFFPASNFDKKDQVVFTVKFTVKENTNNSY